MGGQALSSELDFEARAVAGGLNLVLLPPPPGSQDLFLTDQSGPDAGTDDRRAARGTLWAREPARVAALLPPAGLAAIADNDLQRRRGEPHGHRRRALRRGVAVARPEFRRATQPGGRDWTRTPRGARPASQQQEVRVASRAGRRLALATVVLMSAITADSAHAQLTAGDTAKLRGGTTTLTLGRALGAVGVGVSALPPARTTGRGGLLLPIAGGEIKPATGAGTIADRGGLTLTAGRARARLTDVRLRLGRGSVLSAKVGCTRVVVLSLDAARARVTRSGFDTNVLNLRARLTAAGARVLNRALGLRALTRGMPLGTAAVSGKFAQLLFIGGTTTLTFSPEAMGRPRQSGHRACPDLSGERCRREPLVPDQAQQDRREDPRWPDPAAGRPIADQRRDARGGGQLQHHVGRSPDTQRTRTRRPLRP